MRKFSSFSLFFVDKSKIPCHAAEIANLFYGVDTIAANYVQFWFRQFRLGIFDVKISNRTDLYCQQLERLNLVIEEKWPELVNRRCVVLHQDNASPYISVVTRQNIWELGWEVLMHPPYSPNTGIKRLPSFSRIAKLSE
ncbi:histone-lysine N-methyltransferase SETMAR [Trichonephila clavipes]|nr:histone-lysine N-methyltransferase SETMAR [Trichonephila clavipes]